MNNILDNEWVKKYFDAPEKIAFPGKPVEADVQWLLGCVRANLVLQAMQEPIRKGERYLHLSADGEIIERVNEVEDVPPLHVSSLRLPDKFQREEGGA